MATTILRPLAITCLTSGFFLLGADCSAQTTSGELTLLPELQQAFVAQIPAQRPKRQIGNLIAIEEVDHKANFKKLYADERMVFTVLDSGLIGASGTTVYRNGSSAGMSRGISLCGLVILVSESASTTETSITTLLPIGKMFVPFGVNSSTDFNSRYRASSFTTSTPGLCLPTPGADFTYTVEGELTIKTSGLFGRTTNVHRTSKSLCKVASSPMAAASLNPTLQGEALAVSCEVEVQPGKKRTADYVYLIDSQFYLTTKTADDWQITSIQYPEIVYEHP